MATTYYAPGVYIEEQQSGSRPIQGVGTAIAGFVGRTQTVPQDSAGPVLVTNWSQFKRQFGDLAEGLWLPSSVQGFFQNGGGAAYISAIASGGALGRPTVALPGPDGAPVLEVTATDAGVTAGSLSVEVTDPPEDADPATTFSLIVRQGAQQHARYDGLELKRGAQGAATVVSAASELVVVKDVGRAARPANARYELMVPPATPIDAKAYIGDADARSGLAGLAAIDEVTMLIAPDIAAPASEGGEADVELMGAVHGAMIEQASTLRDRMAILDPPPALLPQGVLSWKSDQPAMDSPFAALYYPWIGVLDPTGRRTMMMPSSGHLAGVWSRSDDARGVHKAPANEGINGAQTLERQTTAAEQEQLNPKGINVIRAFPGRGIRVWGARTTTSTDLDWQYINVRRLFNYIEESIAEGTQWVVFEPNDQALWQRITRTVTAFLTLSWRSGALLGAKPEMAFYVKCDEETNPSEVIEAGQVVIEVGIAPVRPAEFVVFRIAQLTGSAQTS